MHKLFEEKVFLEPISHTYQHKDGRIFESLSRVRNVIKEPFQSEMLSKIVAKRDGKTQSEVLAEWKKAGTTAADHGTNIHEALEFYEKTAVIKPENEFLRPMILCLTAEYKDYYQVHQEVCLYDEEYEIAGTADHIIETTKHKSSILNIDDYKTNISKGIYFENKYKKYLLGPFSYVQDTNYFDYSLQLSSYAYMLEKLTGRKIGTLSIVFIPPNNPLCYKRIPVNYMKMESKALFDFYKEQKHIKKEEGVVQSGIVNESNFLQPNFA
jgi:hypothetical protein